jgi:hypothetical protein
MASQQARINPAGNTAAFKQLSDESGWTDPGIHLFSTGSAMILVQGASDASDAATKEATNGFQIGTNSLYNMGWMDPTTCWVRSAGSTGIFAWVARL